MILFVFNSQNTLLDEAKVRTLNSYARKRAKGIKIMFIEVAINDFLLKTDVDRFST
jgi:hypothetical protein